MYKLPPTLVTQSADIPASVVVKMLMLLAEPQLATADAVVIEELQVVLEAPEMHEISLCLYLQYSISYWGLIDMRGALRTRKSKFSK